MAKNIIFVLTEGEHDAAFIYRILKANGVSTNHLKLKDYPYPLDELFKSGILSTPLEDLNIEVARSRFLPSRVMKKESNILSIYRIGGDSQQQRRSELIKTISSLKSSESNELQAVEEGDVFLLYFFDADDKGVKKRIEQIKEELKNSFPSSEAENINRLSNKEVVRIENIYVGGFIFTALEKDTGLLEDALLPLMRQGNDDIFEEAEKFLAIHETTVLFKDKITFDETRTVKRKIGNEKYTHKKSLIGTVGQLQVSGASNTVCISKADYLTDSKIKADSTCREIYNFILKALK